MNECEGQLKMQHQFTDYLYWNLFIAVPIITACIAILKNSIVWFVFYIIVCIFLVTLVYRFYCTHCPHYIRGVNTTKCMFFWGIPKYFKARPGPLNLFEKAIAFIAPTILILFPLYWLILQPDLLIIYVLSLAVLGATIRRYECGRCIYFDCPVNLVSEETKNPPSSGGPKEQEFPE